MIELVLNLLGMVVLLVFSGLANLAILPDWLVAQRVEGRKLRYFLLSYAAFLLIIPVLYFGGQFIRNNDLGSSNLIFLVAVPLAFGLKFAFLKLGRVSFKKS